MPPISFRKIGLILLTIIALSRTRQILQFIEELNFGGILTLEPLRNSPEEGRFLVTVALCALVFVVLYNLLNQRK